MAAGGGGQNRPEWGRGRRLTQLRGIASGGCLDDSDWKSTIVPSTHAVSEAYLSFKHPTLSRKPTQLRARLASTAAPAARLPIRSPAHSIICRSRLTNRMPGFIAKPAKPLLLVSASSTTGGSAPQRLVVHIPLFPARCFRLMPTRLLCNVGRHLEAGNSAQDLVSNDMLSPLL